MHESRSPEGTDWSGWTAADRECPSQRLQLHSRIEDATWTLALVADDRVAVWKMIGRSLAVRAGAVQRESESRGETLQGVRGLQHEDGAASLPQKAHILQAALVEPRERDVGAVASACGADGRRGFAVRAAGANHRQLPALLAGEEHTQPPRQRRPPHARLQQEQEALALSRGQNGARD